MSKLGKNTNLRTFTIDANAGTQVMDTQQLTGQGKMSKDQNESNPQNEYTTGSMPNPGKLGGMPSRN